MYKRISQALCVTMSAKQRISQRRGIYSQHKIRIYAPVIYTVLNPQSKPNCLVFQIDYPIILSEMIFPSDISIILSV